MTNNSTKYQYTHNILKVQKVFFKIPPAANFNLPILQGILVHIKNLREGNFLGPHNHLKQKKTKKFKKKNQWTGPLNKI